MAVLLSLTMQSVTSSLMQVTLTCAVSMSKLVWTIYIVLAILLHVEVKSGGIVLLPFLLPRQHPEIITPEAA